MAESMRGYITAYNFFCESMYIPCHIDTIKLCAFPSFKKIGCTLECLNYTINKPEFHRNKQQLIDSQERDGTYEIWKIGNI